MNIKIKRLKAGMLGIPSSWHPLHEIHLAMIENQIELKSDIFKVY